MHTDDNDFEYEYDDNNFSDDNKEIKDNVNSNSTIEENFYSYDDFNDNENIDNSNEKKQGNKKKIIIFIIILLLFLISIGVIIFFLGRDNNEIPKPIPIPSITLSSTNFSLTVGSSKNITYTIENDNGNVLVTWSSSNKKIATVSETGTVKAIKAGSATITASYTINGVEYKETCFVTVENKDSSSGGSTGGSSGTTPVKDTTKPTLSYLLTSGKENTWVNTDVSIKVTASDNSGSVTVKYTTNCNR